MNKKMLNLPDDFDDDHDSPKAANHTNQIESKISRNQCSIYKQHVKTKS